MKDPYKIIFKYKNENNVYQNNVYIFIGNVPNDILYILNKFEKLSLLATLKTITKADTKSL